MGCSLTIHMSQLVPEVAPHQHHFVCHVVEHMVKILICGSFETCYFILTTCLSHCVIAHLFTILFFSFSSPLPNFLTFVPHFTRSR